MPGKDDAVNRQLGLVLPRYANFIDSLSFDFQKSFPFLDFLLFGFQIVELV